MQKINLNQFLANDNLVNDNVIQKVIAYSNSLQEGMYASYVELIHDAIVDGVIGQNDLKYSVVNSSTIFKSLDNSTILIPNIWLYAKGYDFNPMGFVIMVDNSYEISNEQKYQYLMNYAIRDDIDNAIMDMYYGTLNVPPFMVYYAIANAIEELKYKCEKEGTISKNEMGKRIELLSMMV